MLHTLRFSLQNAVYFIMLPFLVTVLFTFYIQGVLKFKCKTPVPNVKRRVKSHLPSAGIIIAHHILHVSRIRVKMELQRSDEA